jgi:hypothetical protein
VTSTATRRVQDMASSRDRVVVWYGIVRRHRLLSMVM